ncbi:glycosyltransferase family 39 protein [Cryobacterium sp. 10S3]|uniref:glycosyltransferase family 39 protein n=2 Tax=Cryobacterium TaxID=69578 RepID=UPI002AC9119F|nr:MULTISPECIES: glycosyltransferase family 39 protein [unclassified Cryobacterium]MEB0003153.1 glycosyltransferase family 39 protein [Cryobacterium sp. RTC2.1]MEB0285367.1 glycosyltransferase family 39 protein [Cryobacterium sp. 10S3]WPX13380.1 glycosyltransferase family 39 protein [Cryobacterium sp. 10S3]
MTTQVSPRPSVSPLDARFGARFVTSLAALPRTLVRGRAGSARWERPALLGLLLATAVLYIWDLGASGWANSFYSAAVQAGSVDWTAFFYGSSDAANAITVDKPPASLWLMALSVRLFGLSSWSILVPEALMGVASVAVLFATVRRRFSAGTALLAGAVLAVTPVAALMFRFNNPDALLVLLLSLATYFTLRGIETGALKWVLWAGAMVGFGFLTKQLQAFLILPPLAGVYLYAAPHRFRTRLWHSFAALGAVIVSAGWWVAIVELVPANWRPYIGGSQTNSFLELTFGYNGFGRLTGSETGSVTGGAGGTGALTGGMWGETGIFRLFLGEFGGQITWLLPAALVLCVAALVVLRRAPRISLRRATLLLFAGYLILTALAFSFMAGIFHAYYTVALAPALAGTFAIGASLVWMKRTALWARITAAVAMLATSAWAWVLLDRATDWLPWLKFVVAALGLVAAGLLMAPPRAAWLRRLPGKWWGRATVAIALTGALLAPVAYTLETVSTAHTGSIVTAGPTVSGGMGGMGGGGMPGGRAGFPGGNAGGFAGGGTPPAGPTVGNGTVPNGTVPNGTVPNGTTGTLPTGGRPGGAGGFMGSASVSASLAALLSVDSGSYTWVAAAIGSDSAAGYQLATQLPVMAIGGFNGSDPAPTLAEFQADVAAGKIHYFISGTTGQANGGSSASSEIAAWVAENFTAQTVDSVTLYDLSAGATAASS